MKEGIAILLASLMLLPVIVLAKTNNGLNQNGGSTQPTQKTCEEFCQSQPQIQCVGKWKVSGKYPDCKCEFKCSNSNDNNIKNREGPWTAVGKNKLLCVANINNENQELMLIQKKGNFEAWDFNATDNTTIHYVAFPTSWYKPKVIEKKIQNEHWKKINIIAEDPRVGKCGILPGEYIAKA